MQDNLNNIFDNYIKEFKKMTLKEKKDVSINGLKELLGVSMKVAFDLNIQYNNLLNREIIDINKENATEDDYVEAVYVYTEAIKEVASTVIMEMLKVKEMEYEENYGE